MQYVLRGYMARTWNVDAEGAYALKPGRSSHLQNMHLAGGTHVFLKVKTILLLFYQVYINLGLFLRNYMKQF